MINKLNQVGDTIIEVMIALVIMGSVLAGAYYLSNYSLNTILESHFRSDALYIAQTQLEQLKAQVNSNPSFISSNQNKSSYTGLNSILSQYPQKIASQIAPGYVFVICNPSNPVYNFSICNNYFQSLSAQYPSKSINFMNIEDQILSYLTHKKSDTFCMDGSTIDWVQSSCYFDASCMDGSTIDWVQSSCYFDASGSSTTNTTYPSFLVSISDLDKSWNQIKIDVSWQGRTAGENNHVDLYYGFNNSL